MVHRTFLQLHSKNISTQLVWCPSHQPLRSQRDYKKHFTPSTCVQARTPASHGEQTSVLITAATLKISALKKGEIIYLLIDLRDLNLIICMEPFEAAADKQLKKKQLVQVSRSLRDPELIYWRCYSRPRWAGDFRCTVFLFGWTIPFKVEGTDQYVPYRDLTQNKEGPLVSRHQKLNQLSELHVASWM